jgi:endonuclease G
MQTKMKYLLLVVAIISFTAGVAFEYAFLTYIWPNRHQTYTWIYTLRNHKKPGEPCETDLVLKRQGYSLGYSYEHKTALWVSYIISAGSIGIDVKRHGSFYPDSDIPEKYRVQPEDHVNTGYDKGHLAPSAAIDFSKKVNRETFALSNVTLQDPKLNRQAWAKLEDLERDWTKTKGKLYVVTGPSFSSRPKKVNGMSVPSKFYKVIYSYDAEKAIGFIFPNKAVSNKNLWKYAMSVQEVEKETGLTFFSKFKEKTQKKLKETADIEWWKEEG